MRKLELQTIHALAEALPRLVNTAQQAAMGFLSGRHPSGRAGEGEVFREFRPYEAGDPLNWIDWRRSARDDRTTLKLREKMTPRRIWLWLDRSPSMRVVYDGLPYTKLEASLVLALALAEITSRSGDRVGVLGLHAPVCRRDIVPFYAERMIGTDVLPLHQDRVTAGDEVYLFTDGLLWAEEKIAALQPFLGHAKGRLVHLSNRFEAEFPFLDSVDFIDPTSGAQLRTHNAVDWRETYIERMTALERERRAFCKGNHWPLLAHRAEDAFAPTLGAMHACLEGGGAQSAQGQWVA